jgi:hypothetical protein
VEYETGGAAGETYAGTFGGLAMYDYRFRLPVAFAAQAGVPYWVQIEAWQHGFPGWSLARGTGGDGSHFRCQHVTLDPLADVPTGCYFTRPSGDAAFTLLTRAVTGLDVSPQDAWFALQPPAPNPSSGGQLRLSFTLPDAASAELALYDTNGRRLLHREVGHLGRGPHVLDLASMLPAGPGIYLARLTHGSDTRSVKVAIARGRR